MRGKELEEFIKTIPKMVQLKTNAPIVILTVLDEEGEGHICAKGFGWETIMNEALHKALRVRAQSKRNNDN